MTEEQCSSEKRKKKTKDCRNTTYVSMRPSMTSKLLFFLLTVPSWMPAAMVQAVCRPEYQKLASGVKHTACKTRDPRYEIVTANMTDPQKTEALTAHNKYRSLVAKGDVAGFQPATNMFRLIWDKELADVAQALANLCNARGDHPEERITSNFEHVGQNIEYASEFSAEPVLDASGIVAKWFNQHRGFNPAYVDRYPGSAGADIRFTGISWAETRYVGCGYSVCRVRSRPEAFKIFACNYAPGGNLQGKPVYQRGSACAACPDGTTCDKDTSLCGVDGEWDGISVSGTLYHVLWKVFMGFLIGLIAGLFVAAAVYFMRSRGSPIEEEK